MATIVITGANRGIGLELTKTFIARGDEVIGVCRQSSPSLNCTGAKVIENIDVTNPPDINQLKSKLQSTSIDILINNAGILRPSSINDFNFSDMYKQFEVNAVAPLRVVEALISQLNTGSKIIMITSRMGSMTDNSSGGGYGYRMSKSALNAAGKSLSIDLKEQGIAVALLHPGWVSTEMVNFNGLIEPDESAQGLIKRIDELNMDNTGGFWHTNGEELPW